MTKITIHDQYISIIGHSGYSIEGYDIICASISASAQIIQNVTQCEYEETEDGYKLYIQKDDTNAIVFIDYIKQLESQYGDYVKVV